MRLAGRVAVVTGGGRGIGRGISRRFAIEGATVVIAQRDAQSATQTVRDIEESGGQATYVRTDVSLAADVTALAQSVEQKYGCAHILVNNAGLTGLDKSILDMSLE